PAMNHGGPDFRMMCRLSRRSLLKAGSARLAGLNLPALLRAAETSASGTRPQALGRARPGVFLHQDGGAAPNPTLPPKPGAPRRTPRRAPRAPTPPAGSGSPRAPAPVGRGGGKFPRDPRGDPREQKPNSARLLQPAGPGPPDRPPAIARHAGTLPRLWQHD